MKKLFILVVLLGITLNATQAQQILKPAEPNEVCMEAWQNYRKADVLWKTGWGLFGAGMGLVLGGGIFAMCNMYTPEPEPLMENNPRVSAFNIGFYTMIVGGGITLASIPCLAVGQVRRKEAANLYNTKCNPDQPILSFSLQTSSNGLGLAMHF